MVFWYFWNVIASPFVNAINSSFQKGQLSVTQRQSIISVLPKKDNNPLFLKKWRPISLLNCDCKIASKAIGNRMKQVLPEIINNKLNFSKHISNVCKKINNQFNVMLRFRKLIRKEILFKLYKAYILPHFYYCSSVWHFCGARDADKLEALNKRILRFILGDYSSPYNTLLSKVSSTSLWVSISCKTP